jgi:uncharacterized protein (TIGR03083 family)
MSSAEVWAMVHQERAALARDLAPLDEAQWAAPSLCDEWTVRDVVAHMTATASLTPPGFFAQLLTSGFSFAKVSAKGIASHRGASPAETLARFEAVADSTSHPPGPTDSWLGETVVHADDVRRALGITHEYPSAASTRVADFYKGSNLILGAKRRIAGLRLQATDTDWSHGTGPEVSGPIQSLVMAMTGRKGALADLSGEGVATLASRP